MSSGNSVNLAVVGATGMVGRQVLKIIDELELPISNIRLFASYRSKDITLNCLGKNWTVEDIEDQNVNTLSELDIAIFSAGGYISKKWAPIFESANCIVIDNSSAWRTNDNIPLVVSEVNHNDLNNLTAKHTNARKIIANPNCTTMAMMPVIAPLHSKYNLTRLMVATYQAVSGGGVQGIEELAGQVEKLTEQSSECVNIRDLALNNDALEYPVLNKFAEPIAFNVVPYAGNLVNDGLYETDEEQKLRNESRKILHIPNLKVSGTCVRVPVFTGHTLVVHLEFENEMELSDVYDILKNANGVQLLGNVAFLSESKINDIMNDNNTHSFARGADAVGIPTPLKATGGNKSLVGRVRYDYSLDNHKKGLILVISGDNLRKGAALNAVQIAKILCDKMKFS